MRKPILAACTAAVVAIVGGCATPERPVDVMDNIVAESFTPQGRAVWTAPAPVLRHKIALGRISNETTYGKSLIRNEDGDPVGKQVADMLAKALVESGRFTVLERTDIASLAKEQNVTGNSFTAVGADLLLVGSVTEFGRKNVGKIGFLSDTQKQTARAAMSVRLVDVTTGQVVFSCSGAGEADVEHGTVLGWGSTAGYDSTLNDRVVSIAASEVVNQLVTRLADRPWRSYFLSTDRGSVAISGGARQGLVPGMRLAVKVPGKKVISRQTGFAVELPSRKVATVEVLQTFGDSVETEGSIVEVVSGSIAGISADNLIVEQE